MSKWSYLSPCYNFFDYIAKKSSVNDNSFNFCFYMVLEYFLVLIFSIDIYNIVHNRRSNQEELQRLKSSKTTATDRDALKRMKVNFHGQFISECSCYFGPYKSIYSGIHEISQALILHLTYSNWRQFGLHFMVNSGRIFRSVRPLRMPKKGDFYRYDSGGFADYWSAWNNSFDCFKSCVVLWLLKC